MHFEELMDERMKYYPYSRDDPITDIKKITEYCLRTRYSDGRTDYYNAHTKTISFYSSKTDVPRFEEGNWLSNFSWYLRNEMILRNLTQAELSKKTGISRIMISRYMNGTVMPSACNIALIAKALRCSTDDLINF